MSQSDNLRDEIIGLLLSKGSIKQDIADYSEKMFDSFYEIASQEIEVMKEKVEDSRVRLRIEKRGKYEFLMYIGSDVIVVQLHTNVFRLDDEHALWSHEYLQDNPENGYFAIINIYNFLAESYEKKRVNDRGYLIGRVFMNRDEKCMVEGKGILDQVFEDVLYADLNDEAIRTIIQCASIFAIDFDLMCPPYELVQEVSVMQIQEISSELQLATGKRLGFKFSAEDNTTF